MKHFLAALAVGASALILSVPPSWSEVFAVPVSGEVIEGNLFLGGSDKPVAHFEAREGSMVTVRSEIDGYWYGVTPILDENRQPAFLAFQIFDLGDGRQDVQQILPKDARSVEGGVSVPVGSAGSTSVTLIQGTPSLAVRVDSVEHKDFLIKANLKPLKSGGRPQQLQKTFGASGGGICVVSCGGASVTATGVEMKCGRCESGALPVPPARP